MPGIADPSSPSTDSSAPLRFERCHTLALLAWGLLLMAVIAAPPALALRSSAPEASRAILVWTLVTAVAYSVLVVAQRRAWLLTTVEVTADTLVVRRSPMPPERIPLRAIRRMRHGPLGLRVWEDAEPGVLVGRLAARDAVRLMARLESRTGVPVEGLSRPVD